MSRISIEEVKHVAHLARLAITDEEAAMFTEQLDSIISFAEELNEVDTENVKPNNARIANEEYHEGRCT